MGRTIAEEVAGDRLEPLTHYPRGDVYDPFSGSQYYFHLHRPEDFGHFHVFLRAQGMPPGLVPASCPGVEKNRSPLCHLVAIGLDRRGEVGCLFTTNRWVTAETWYDAPQVTAMLPCFHVGHAEPSPMANRWIRSVMTLFHPQISDLLLARDVRVAERAGEIGKQAALEDRDLEITSCLEVDVDERIRSGIRGA